MSERPKMNEWQIRAERREAEERRRDRLQVAGAVLGIVAAGAMIGKWWHSEDQQVKQAQAEIAAKIAEHQPARDKAENAYDAFMRGGKTVIKHGETRLKISLPENYDKEHQVDHLGETLGIAKGARIYDEGDSEHDAGAYAMSMLAEDLKSQLGTDLEGNYATKNELIIRGTVATLAVNGLENWEGVQLRDVVKTYEEDDNYVNAESVISFAAQELGEHLVNGRDIQVPDFSQ